MTLMGAGARPGSEGTELATSWTLRDHTVLRFRGPLHLASFYACFTAAPRTYRLERTQRQSCPS